MQRACITKCCTELRLVQQLRALSKACSSHTTPRTACPSASCLPRAKHTASTELYRQPIPHRTTRQCTVRQRHCRLTPRAVRYTPRMRTHQGSAPPSSQQLSESARSGTSSPGPAAPAAASGSAAAATPPIPAPAAASTAAPAGPPTGCSCCCSCCRCCTGPAAVPAAAAPAMSRCPCPHGHPSWCGGASTAYMWEGGWQERGSVSVRCRGMGNFIVPSRSVLVEVRSFQEGWVRCGDGCTARVCRGVGAHQRWSGTGWVQRACITKCCTELRLVQQLRALGSLQYGVQTCR